MPAKLDLGHLIEGVVEQDPMTDQFYIRTTDAQGQPVRFDVQTALARLVGKEVRLTLASFETLSRLASMVEEQGGGQVVGISAQEIMRKFD